MEPFEPPKYLEKLIAAINDGAKSAQLGALAFTAIGVFLLATAFSATDEDLLLNRTLVISQLGGTAVPVVFAFGLAPAVFVAAHFYTLIRYDMMAGNMRRFRDDLAVMVRSDEDRDRCRQLLANVEFVNALAMPKGSRASSWMFSWTVRMLLAVFPVAVLLFVQLQSLRLQSEWVNWTHHVCIAADLVLLVWFFRRLRGDDTWSLRAAPVRRIVALCWIPLVVIAVDMAWLRVPGPGSETTGKDLAAYLDQYPGPSASFMQRVRWWSEFHPVDLLLCTPGAWGCRFLTVARRNIVAKILDATTFVALRAGADADEKHLASFEATSLRGRTLRFADLTASKLFGADLTDADLRRANLTAAVLKKGTLRGALLQGTVLAGAELQGADLNTAQLQGADLSQAQLQGTNLSSAHLEGAQLGGAQLRGADLAQAQLQGTDLFGAQLQGAVLFGAQLQGANLSFARLQGTDLREAGLWNITLDKNTRLGLADLRGVNFDEVPTEDPVSGLGTGRFFEALKQHLRERRIPQEGAGMLPRTVNTSDGKILVTNPNDAVWRDFDRTRLTTAPAEIDPALAILLATVAQVAPEIVAGRIYYSWMGWFDEDRPLTILLGCRLQALVDAKRLILRADIMEGLREIAGPCSQPSP